MNNKNLEKIYNMSFAKIYSLYLNKIEKKGKTKAQLDGLLHWLTGYTNLQIVDSIKEEKNLRNFFKEAPKLNDKRKLITGVICGYRIEYIKEETLKEIRYMDKIIDELAKGKDIKKIKRT